MAPLAGDAAPCLKGGPEPGPTSLWLGLEKPPAGRDAWGCEQAALAAVPAWNAALRDQVQT